MEYAMEYILTAVAIPSIFALFYWIGYLRERTATSKEERRNIERRVGVLEDEIKDLRQVYVSLGKIDTNIQHILESLHDAGQQLVGLSNWQKGRESAIDEAVEFIREARGDGIRSKS